MEISTKDYWLKNDQLMNKEELPGDFIEQGTSLYEAFRVIDGVPLFLEEHLERLHNTSRLTGLTLQVDDETIRKRIYQMINANQVQTGNLKLVANFRHQDRPADLYIYFTKDRYPTEADYQNGVKTVLVHIERPIPNAKVDRTDYRKVIDTAKTETGSYEALLVDHEGYVSEGGRSNLFMIKGDLVITTPGDKVLKGINRQMTLKACSNLSQQVEEKDVSREEMHKMDAIFITGTSPLVLPVSKVDDTKFDSAKNPILRKIMKEFDRIVAEYIRNNRY